MTRVLRFPALPVLLRMFALLALAGLLAGLLLIGH